jgi:hypothetical protein
MRTHGYLSEKVKVSDSVDENDDTSRRVPGIHNTNGPRRSASRSC